jgi:hypothetical protein
MLRGPRQVDLWARIVSIVSIMSAVTAMAACGDSDTATKQGKDTRAGTSTGAPTAAQLAEARRLLNPENQPQAPTADEVACVARVVVQDPTVDQIANDMAQIPDKDLRELVMTSYLGCAHDFVLDLYMRFAPPDLSPSQLDCVRSKFAELTIKRLSEVIVEDPDAGYTGPLAIQACKSGSPSNPLQYGTLPEMGGS